MEPEFEEVLLFANFKDVPDENVSEKNDYNFFKAIGMDTETPFVQLNNCVYRGEYEEGSGTHLLFEDDDDPQEADPVFGNSAEVPLKYFCKTKKALGLEKIFFKAKNENAVENEVVSENENKSATAGCNAATVQEAVDNFEVYIHQFPKNNLPKTDSKSTKGPNRKSEEPPIED